MFLLLALTTVFLLHRLLLALFLAQIAHFQLRTAHHPSRMRKRIRHFLGIILSGCRRTLKHRHLALCTGQRRGCTLRLLRPEQLSCFFEVPPELLTPAICSNVFVLFRMESVPVIDA